MNHTIRQRVDFDYASEQMILDGALDRYKVLVFLWGAVTEKPVLERIEEWVRKGRTIVFADRPRGLPETVEGDNSIAKKWLKGETGTGRVILWQGDLIPSQSYVDFLRGVILETPSLQAATRMALEIQKPNTVYCSVLENGKTALLNFGERPATVHLSQEKTVTIEPYDMTME